MFTTEKQDNSLSNSDLIIISRVDYERICDIAADKLSKSIDNLNTGQFDKVNTGVLHAPGY